MNRHKDNINNIFIRVLKHMCIINNKCYNRIAMLGVAIGV